LIVGILLQNINGNYFIERKQEGTLLKNKKKKRYCHKGLPEKGDKVEAPSLVLSNPDE
jgi:hypothetical protein